jgi:hypothetical protein
MTDITTISTDDLEKDLQESRNDISVCEAALLQGVANYSGGSVGSACGRAWRLRVFILANKRFVEVITKELNRRIIP